MPEDFPTILTGRLRRRDWVRVTRGAHRPCDVDDDFVADLHAWTAVLPTGSVFTHLTAARLWGWWLPPLPDDAPVFAATVMGRTASTRPGVVVSRHKAQLAHADLEGLRVAQPAEVLLACARDVGVIDLVVMVTSALRNGDCTLDDLSTAAASSRRGSRRLREAISLMEVKCESAWEVVLRLFHVSCEIDVEAQHEVVADDGQFVARGDLWLVGTRTLHEYDGGDHLQTSQQRKDLKRSTRLGHSEWIRRGYTSQDVISQAIVILRDADESLGREHRPERVRAWHRLLRESLFTPAGTEMFRRRLGLTVPSEELGA
jgi:hypothetical protein